MKMLSRTDAEKRYGLIDFSSKHWGDRERWLRFFEIPTDWFPNWRVLNTQMPVRHIACNIDLHAPLAAALSNIHKKGLGSELKTFDGCFNIRMVRGSKHSFSAHSYGLALDINAALNPMGLELHTRFSSQFVACFKDEGFDWGGDFKSRKDPMHFSYCWE